MAPTTNLPIVSIYPALALGTHAANGTVQFVIERSGPPTSSLTVDFSVTGGTVTGGSNTSVPIGANNDSATITVTPTDTNTNDTTYVTVNLTPEST